MCVIRYVESIFNCVCLNVGAFLVTVRPFFLVGHLCAVVTGSVDLIEIIDCLIVCKVHLLFVQVCVIINTVGVRLWETRDGGWVHGEMRHVGSRVGVVI